VQKGSMFGRDLGGSVERGLGYVVGHSTVQGGTAGGVLEDQSLRKGSSKKKKADAFARGWKGEWGPPSEMSWSDGGYPGGGKWQLFSKGKNKLLKKIGQHLRVKDSLQGFVWAGT